jgi:hypothetical protein
MFELLHVQAQLNVTVSEKELFYYVLLSYIENQLKFRFKSDYFRNKKNHNLTIIESDLKIED